MTQTIQFSSSYSGCGPYMDLQAREQEDSLLVENLAQLFQNSLLVRHGDGPLGPRVLYEAVKQGKGDIVKQLLEHNVSPSVLQEGLSPLYMACKTQNVSITCLLLDSHADPLQRNNLSDPRNKYWQYSGNSEEHNATPIQAAAVAGCIKLVRLLIDRKAAIDIVGGDGNTPLAAALSAKQEKMALFLIQKGAKLNIRNQFEATPLTWAVKYDFLAVVEAMVKRGVDLTTTTSNGVSCLYIAAQGSSPQLLDFLLKKGCKKMINNFSWEDQTPLFTAVRHNRAENVRLLLEARADLHKGENILLESKKGLKRNISYYTKAKDSDKKEWAESVAKSKKILEYLKKTMRTQMRTPILPPPRKKEKQTQKKMPRTEADEKDSLGGVEQVTLYHISMAIKSAGANAPFFLYDLRKKANAQDDWKPTHNPFCQTLDLMKAHLLVNPEGCMLERTKTIVKACVIGTGFDITFKPAKLLKTTTGTSDFLLRKGKKQKKDVRSPIAVYTGLKQLTYLDPRTKHQRLFTSRT
jgi:ankyrin repeat protein